MDENKTKNKIKVLNVFQNEELIKNKEKSHHFNKFEFEKGIILNAIVSTPSNKNLKIDEKKEKEKKNCIIFREQCEYCLTDFSISGHLILTKESLLFEPDLRDKNVITDGLGTYQIFIDLYDIYECAHIVVPTKDTYLCNNEDTCGFIQVLLKSIYTRICDDPSHKKGNLISNYATNDCNDNSTNNNNNNNSNNCYNDENKQKSISYYKYISKSLSYVFNLAQPLVTTSLTYKENKNDKAQNAEDISDFSFKESSTNNISATQNNVNNATNKYNTTICDDAKNDNINNSVLKNNEQKLNNMISFDMSTSNNNNHNNNNNNNNDNIVDHLHDSDLKIYQKINEINYSTVISSYPDITYKNSLNLVSSQSSLKDDLSSDCDKKNNHQYKNKKGKQILKESKGSFTFSSDSNNNFLSDTTQNVKQINEYDHNRHKSSFDTTKECNTHNTTYMNENKINNECNINNKDNNNNIYIDENIKENNKNNLLNDNISKNEMKEKKCIDDIKREETTYSLYDQNDSYSKTLKNISFELHNEERHDKLNSSYNNNNNKDNLLTTITNEHNELTKKPHKKYEEKSFILFRFFNNNKAYETTTKIIKEIDEVRNSKNKIKKTITSVPFTSNELLRSIIEKSLIENNNKNVPKKSSLNDINDLKYLALIPKLEYINGAVKLLNKEMTKQINYYLPPTLSIKIWKLAFCSSIHGVSFKTLYRSVYNKGSVILLIYDMNNVLFGYFLNKLHCDNCYYGSGENFLFTFKNNKLLNNNNNNTRYKSIDTSYESFSKPILDHIEKKKKQDNLSTKNYFTQSNMSSQDKLIVPFDHNDECSNKNDSKIQHDDSTSKSVQHTKTLNHVDMLDDEFSKKNHNYSDNTLNDEKSNCSDLHSNNNNNNNNMYDKNMSSNDSCIFNTINNIKKKTSLSSTNDNHNNNNENDNISIQVYAWTTKNNYFVYSDEKSITIGGGDNYALVINEDLCKGQTNKSKTYDNDLLTYDEEFEIQFLQLWVFDDC
ncbi:TLD domain-containing protein [Plasmodium gaboni]|uniref:Oxidation resistance protein 1 n=1 Tax=Plasmodium gaboni TaxID=647221 RepID=A0ABY1UMX4_9APIC|nr:TLD domain-containing protein [Plasmodium gaboni]